MRSQACITKFKTLLKKIDPETNQHISTEVVLMCKETFGA